MQPPTKFCFVLFFCFACSLFVHKSIAADVTCEKLSPQQCSFAVSSTGKRCVLQSSTVCKASETVATKFLGYIETDQCVNACGVDRQAVGMSSDPFTSPDFTTRLCSPACFNSCPNIVDLYSNLAAGEGLSLQRRCASNIAQPPAADADDRRSSLEVELAPTPAAEMDDIELAVTAEVTEIDVDSDPDSGVTSATETTWVEVDEVDGTGQ